jgi:small-conductance mechanosensitive channel
MDAYYAAKAYLLESIKNRFDLEGVEIPYPYRTIVYKKDLARAPGEGSPAEPTEAKT